ncbi:MAG: hypothetical protein RSB91_03965 [Clostridia bacterium]
MKNSKGNMLLIELIIAILFFSLSQVVIVQVFATAQQKTVESKLLKTALAQAEDVAEQLSLTATPDELLLRLGFMGADGYYVLTNAAGFDLYVTLQRLSQPAGQLRTATITVRSDARELFTFPCACYLPKEAQP